MFDRVACLIGEANVGSALVCDVCSGKGWLALLFRELGARVLAVDKGFGKIASGHMDFLHEMGVSTLQLDVLADRLFCLSAEHFYRSGGSIFPHSLDNFSDSSSKRREELAKLTEDLDLATQKLNSARSRAVMVSIHPCGVLAERVLQVFSSQMKKQSGVCARKII